ncbi:MAG TPA: VOC family protein [Dehalococcoidia bacterium]|nr:VOC family protein [Dehalococcoidia bacterium]
MNIKRVHHITIATRDAGVARTTFETLFGAAPADNHAIPAFDVHAVEMALGDTTLEIVAPADADSAVMRFLERKGEGFYNLALEVDALDDAVAELRARGVRVSDPVSPGPGLRAAFIAMAATHGLSVQLVEVQEQRAAATAPPVATAPESVGVATEVPSPVPLPAVTPPTPQPVPPLHGAAAPPPLDLTPDEWSDLD